MWPFKLKKKATLFGSRIQFDGYTSGSVAGDLPVRLLLWMSMYPLTPCLVLTQAI